MRRDKILVAEGSSTCVCNWIQHIDSGLFCQECRLDTWISTPTCFPCHSRTFPNLIHLLFGSLSGLDHGAAACPSGSVRCWFPWLLQSGHWTQQEDRLWCQGVPSCHGFGALAEEVEFWLHFCGWGASSVAVQNAKVDRVVPVVSHSQGWTGFPIHHGTGDWRRGLVRLRHHGACLDCSPRIRLFGRFALETSWEVQAGAGLLQFGCWSETLPDGVEGAGTGSMAYQWQDALQ